MREELRGSPETDGGGGQGPALFPSHSLGSAPARAFLSRQLQKGGGPRTGAPEWDPPRGPSKAEFRGLLPPSEGLEEAGLLTSDGKGEGGARAARGRGMCGQGMCGQGRGQHLLRLVK